MFRIAVCFFLLAHGFLAKAGTPVRWCEAVPVTGIRHWICATGDDSDKPILLFLHGGPGNSVMGYSNKFTSMLRKEFIVVLWDQRNSGKTDSLNTATPVSLGIMKNDAVGVIEYLRSRFKQDRIYLAGHSWGGFLALLVAHEHPELLRACFAVSPMIYQEKSEQESLEWMKRVAKSGGREDAEAELSMVHIPFHRMEDLYFHRKWLAILQGNKPPTRDFVEQWSRQWLPLLMEASAVDLAETATDFRCPVYFFVGKKDHQTHFQITEDYYKKLTAEKKELFWFVNSGHNLNLTEPKKLEEIIISLKTP